MQCFNLDRLGKVIIHTGSKTLFTVALHSIGRHSYNARSLLRWQILVNGARRLQPIHFRHLHIHENHIIALSLQCLQYLQAVTGNISSISHTCQEVQCQPLVNCVILRQQNV